MNKKEYKFIFFLALLVLWTNATVSLAQEISNSELVAAAKALAAGNATKVQEAVLFANNTRLNNLAMAGKISDAEYQINQKIFVKKNDELISAASAKYGLTSASAADPKIFKAGTDTDRQLVSREGRLTVNDVKQVRGSYNDAVAEYLKKNGLKVGSGENWAARLSTDIMPSPGDMKPSDFKAANSFINASGGLAYTDATAAKIQLELDAGSLKTPSLYEAEAYHNEMQKKIRQMNDEITNLKSRRSGLSNSDDLENLDIEIRKRTAFMSKYIARDNKIADILFSGKDQSGFSEISYEKTAAGQLKKAQTRDASSAAIRSEAHVAAVSSHLATKATRKFNDAIAGAALAGGDTAAAGKIIAGNLSSFSPAQQAQAIADIEVKHGATFARTVSKELKSGAAVKTSGGNNITISRSLGLVSAAAGIASQYAQGKNTAEIVWNMTIGGTLENVGRSTSDFTQKEIERLKDRYRASGEDPDTTAVKLKIMAEASVKGTFYGAAIGGYDLLKSATSTTAGAAVAVTDPVIFLVGEALDTRNVLETAYAEIKAQNMEQSVQNARAVKFASEALKELRQMSEQAVRIRSLLEQNKNSARLFCRNHEHELEILQEDLRTINSMDIAKFAAALPEKQKKLQKTLTDSVQESTRLCRQAEITAKAFLAAGDQKDVRNVIAALEQAYARNSIIVESCREEMFEIGQAASVDSLQNALSDFLSRSAALQESSRQAIKNAGLMRQNVSLLKKTVTDFTTLRDRVLSAEAFFVGRRESHEAEWMILKNKISALTKPEDTLPEGFNAELGTLERLPERISSQIKNLKPAQGVSLEESAGTSEAADKALEALMPLFNQAVNSLVQLQQWMKNLRDLLKSPPLTTEISGTLICPSSGLVGESLTMSLNIKLPGDSGGQSSSYVPKDPFGGYAPESPEGMLALAEYKRNNNPSATALSKSSDIAAAVIWDFGDGTSSGKTKKTSVSHSYKNPGRYTLRVSVFYPEGSSSQVFSETKVISISAKQASKDKPSQHQPSSDASSKRKPLPCGHYPGECPTSGIQSLKCRLHQGKISER